MRLFVLLLCLSFATLSFGQFSYTETDNITYTSVSGQPQQLDLFQPFRARGQVGPGIIFVHGGGWGGGSKADYQGWGQYYAGLGYTCISINYRMIPNVWPAEIDDTQAAVRWMRKNATSIGLDPTRIGAIGASAGGHLVLFLGETETLHDFDPSLHGYSSKVQVVADYFGPTNFNNFSEWTPSILQLIQALLGPQNMKSISGILSASPISYVSTNDSPTLVFHGDVDTTVPVDQSREVVARKELFGAPVTYYELPGEGHGFNGTDTWTTILIINSYFGNILNPPNHR